MRTVRDIPKLENIPVLVRAALNEPVKEGVVTNTFRLTRAIETLKYLQAKGARVIAISHIDPPGTTEVGVTAATLEPIAKKLAEMLPRVTFCPITVGPEAREAVRSILPGEIIVMENLRRNAGETKNDPEFAKELAMLADVFVEDSFDVCHRLHASVVGVPKLLPSYLGLLAEREVHELTKALSPAHPSLAIIGGAKFSTKKSVLAKLLKTYDHVYVGGALANDFIKAAGHSVGASLISGAPDAEIQELLSNPRLIMPRDYVVAPFGKARTEGRVAKEGDVGDGEAILDAGPETIAMLAGLISGAKSILWNGPLGNCENGFTEATDAVAQTIARSRAYAVVGGGDTVAAIEKLGLDTDFSFVSTGGGAMLDFLAKGNLPGLDVLG
jgi:phosphoglycerate kinase